MAEAGFFRKLMRIVVPKGIRHKLHVLLLESAGISQYQNQYHDYSDKDNNINDEQLIGLIQLLDRRILTIESKLYDLKNKLKDM